jgi:hypothetical protein
VVLGHTSWTTPRITPLFLTKRVLSPLKWRHSSSLIFPQQLPILATTLQFGADPPKNSHPKKPKTYEVPPLKEGETDKGWSMATVIRKKGGKAVKVIYYHTDEWDTKYSKSDAGSSVSGGWTKKGKLLFIEWVKIVEAARNHRGTRAMEDLIWRALQAEYSIQADNPEVDDLVTRRSVASGIFPLAIPASAPTFIKTQSSHYSHHA